MLVKNDTALLKKTYHTFEELLYDFKQDFVRLIFKKKCTAKRYRQIIPIFLDYIYHIKESVIYSLLTFGKTLESWQEEVLTQVSEKLFKIA